MVEDNSLEHSSVEAVSPVTYTSILQEHDIARTQRETREQRKQLLEEMSASELNNDRGPNAVIAYIAQDMLVPSDIPVLGNILLKVGDVETLNLILHSPGGEGTTVEKFVGLCRAQCNRFRVFIPNEAKSAATLIALGADEIVMGPPAELGPIDAQVLVVANGVARLISAQSFIDARDELLKKHADELKNNQDTTATMQMIATLDLPFINECERLMDFGRDVAKKLLEQYMFKGQQNKTAKIKKVVDTLSSVKRFKVHGRRVDGSTARRELGLKVSLRGKNDPLWIKIWEYYTRAEIAMPRGNASKFIETEHELIVATPRN